MSAREVWSEAPANCDAKPYWTPQNLCMNADLLAVTHIIDSARRIQAYVDGVTREDFRLDVQLQDAVLRRFEIIGEASGRISVHFKDANPTVRWKDMIGMRNRVIHAYDDVDVEIVWETVQRDIPTLAAQLVALLPPGLEL